MSQTDKIPIEYGKDPAVNGLGMMIGQYLEQNLAEYEKKMRQAKKINIRTSVEVEKGISTTIKFNKKKIVIQNGVAVDTQLHLKAGYMTLADVLTGKANPVKGVLTGKIKLKKISATKLIQSIKLLYFLKIPADLMKDDNRRHACLFGAGSLIPFILGSILGFAAAYLLIMSGWI